MTTAQPGVVTLDFRPMKAAMANVAASLQEAVARAQRFLGTLRDRANDPVHIAGLEARFHVRAALDPDYTDEFAITWLVNRIMQGEVPELFFITRANRARIAAAALNAWVEAHPAQEVTVLAWHRLIGSVPVVVTRAGSVTA